MKKILLDTNAYSHLLRGDQTVFHTLSQSETIYFSIFVMAELLTGFKQGNKEISNKDLLFRFISKPTVRVLDATIETAQIFSQIKTALSEAGTPIPIHDIWIASHAMEIGAVLVTYDDHFKKIYGLRLWDNIGQP